MGKKLRTALFSTLLFSALYFLFGIIQRDTGGLIIVILCVVVGNFLYGIPVSYLSDYLTREMKNFRFVVSGFIHIFFGFLTAFVLSVLGMYAVVCSLLFFLLSELERKENRNLLQANKKFIFFNLLVMIAFFILGIYGVLILAATMS